MKHRILTLTLLLTAITFAAEANPVDMNTAREVALKFVNANTKTHLRGAEELQLVTTYSISRGDAAFHIFNTPNGFVIVAADDCATPILGYSDEGRPFDMNNIPIQLQDVLQEYVEQIQYAVENHLVADEETAEQWRLVQSTGRLSNNRDNIQVGPLLTTTWDQGQFYNAMCPEDPDGLDGHALTGCVATAMAQIINYWEYPTHGRGSHSFNVSNLDPGSMPGTNTTGYGTLSVDFEAATYDYNQMPDELDSESTQEEINAVALLMYHCGVAVNMFYGPSSSGAYEEDARSALISYFGYAPSLGYAQRQMYTESEWNDTLKANIDRGEPVLYFGKNAFGAHAFVLDGYDQSNYYHFNFGWSGDCDGWFLTKAINVSWGFNEWQSAIMGIRPDSNSHAIICHRTMYVQNIDHFTVTEPVDLYPMRGGSNYLATNELTGVRIDLKLVPEDSLGQLVIDVLDFGMEHSVVIYDGVNKDSLVRVIETRNLNDWNTVTYHTWFYEGLPEDSIFQNMASTDFSPIVSTRHGFTVLAYSYGGVPESFRLQVRNSTDISPNTPSNNDNVYWTDIVTSEPDGFLLDGDTIRITSAEGLAWVSRYLDSIWLVGTDWEVYQYDHHFISIENDLDLDGYFWKPIRAWFGNIDGHGHAITNMKVSSSNYGGLFETVFNSTVSDIGMIDAVVNAVSNAGTIAGYISNCIVTNCYSTNHIISVGNHTPGGLIGSALEASIINNCYAYGDVCAQFGYGGLVGYISNSEINNCVTQLGEAFNWYSPYGWTGLITEEAHGGTFSNCFSDISIAKRNWISQSPEYDYLAKRAYFLGNVYNVDEIDNLAAFNIAMDSTGMLLADTAVNYSLGENIDVITALNNRVTEYNLPNLRTWVMDNETHMPVFGDFFEVTCPNVSDIAAENIVYNNGFAVALSWQENGDAEEWQVKYNIRNSPEESAIVITTNATQDTLQGLQLGNEYVIYVRPVCGDDTVGWGLPFTFFVDKPLWIDVVTSCPEGYYEDSNGNVTISSPEGLAWLAKIGFNYRQDTIFIANDLDMGAYKWTPIGRDSFQGTVEGNNHIISNIYCNESDLEGIGLFARAYYTASFKNIIIQNSSFSGGFDVGALVGYMENGTVSNCHVTNVIVKGLEDVGGLGGLFSQCETYNCSSSGIVYADYNEGGLIGRQYGTITNCYSSCIISPLGYKDRMSYGGLLGFASGTVSNCYSFGNVEMEANDPFYTWGVYFGGTSIGYLYNVNVTHTYAQRSGLMPFAARFEGDVSLSDTASLVNNTLQTPVTIAGTSYTDLLPALNAWVDANNTNGEYLHWVEDTAMVNNGFPIFEELPSTPITQTTHFISPGIWSESSNWSDNTLPSADAIVFIDAPCQLDQNASVAALTVSDGQSLTLLSGNTLTVTGTLVNMDASGLVIKDGAQLIHSSEGVYATMEKGITGYTDDGGFCLLAVPFTDSVSVPEQMTGGEYDLYLFDQYYPNAEWRNHKADAFSLVRGQGYLYANSNDTTLTLTGQIPPTDEPFSASIFLYADANTFFNLLGNPFTCDAYLSDGRPYLVMNSDGTGLVLAETSAIPPMKGIFVEAVAFDDTVTFTTESPSKSIGRSVTLRLGSGEDANMEAVRVCFDRGDRMDKLMLNDAATRLYIPENGKDYTVAVAEAEKRKPVNFKAGTDGVYTLTAEIENADLDYLHLIDNLTGEDIDLLALRRTQGTMSYTFVAKTSDPVARFTLAFGLKR